MTFCLIILNQNIKTKQNYVTQMLTALLFILKLKIFTKTLMTIMKYRFQSVKQKSNWSLKVVGLRAKTWAYLMNDIINIKKQKE